MLCLDLTVPAVDDLDGTVAALMSQGATHGPAPHVRAAADRPSAPGAVWLVDPDGNEFRVRALA